MVEIQKILGNISSAVQDQGQESRFGHVVIIRVISCTVEGLAFKLEHMMY